MANQVSLTGLDEEELLQQMAQLIRASRARVLGIASAFVSVRGIDHLRRILARRKGVRYCLAAGVDHFITHPAALYAAREANWQLRIGLCARGMFHPTLVVAGMDVSDKGEISDVRCVYLGSSNLTDAGLRRNVECGLLSTDETTCQGAAEALAAIWRASRDPTDAFLRNYAARFAQRNRRRPMEELDALGVADTEEPTALPPPDLRQRPPSRL
jgi:phosphatidylserine/phosphatidylglycerophosphate/cardiolipin synthase-like enzyme